MTGILAGIAELVYNGRQVSYEAHMWYLVRIVVAHVCCYGRPWIPSCSGMVQGLSLSTVQHYTKLLTDARTEDAGEWANLSILGTICTECACAALCAIRAATSGVGSLSFADITRRILLLSGTRGGQ